MKDRFSDMIELIERYGACAALGAGGALIVAFSDRLIWGPLAPKIIGSILVALAGGLVTYVGIDFVRKYQEAGRIRLVFAMLLNAFLSIAGFYFVLAAVQAAKASLVG